MDYEEEYQDLESDYEGEVDLEDDESYYKTTEEAEDSLEEVYDGFFEDAPAKNDKDVEYEYDAIVGGRDKKPVMSVLNKGKLSTREMDDLFNQH